MRRDQRAEVGGEKVAGDFEIGEGIDRIARPRRDQQIAQPVTGRRIVECPLDRRMFQQVWHAHFASTEGRAPPDPSASFAVITIAKVFPLALSRYALAQLCHELSGKPDDMNSPDIEPCQPLLAARPRKPSRPTGKPGPPRQEGDKQRRKSRDQRKMEHTVCARARSVRTVYQRFSTGTNKMRIGIVSMPASTLADLRGGLVALRPGSGIEMMRDVVRRALA